MDTNTQLAFASRQTNEAERKYASTGSPGLCSRALRSISVGKQCNSLHRPSNVSISIPSSHEKPAFWHDGTLGYQDLFLTLD